MIGVPLVIVFVPIAWLVLTRFVYPVQTDDIPGAKELLANAKESLPKLTVPEKRTLVVFVFTAAAWITRPLLNQWTLGDWQPLVGLTDTGVAIISGIVLFITPAGAGKGERLMDWNTALKLPWGLLLLFGGGLSLAGALDSSGFSAFLGAQTGALAGLPVWLIVVFVVAVVIFMTELTSNFATTATLVPVLYAVAIGLGIKPELIIVPAAIAASCAFMLPVATPPNAIVFGSGKVTVPQMSRAGFFLNIVGILLVSTIIYAILTVILK
jgi:sodium-dependent dicarboxylate transporter 2/3/5